MDCWLSVRSVRVIRNFIRLLENDLLLAGRIDIGWSKCGCDYVQGLMVIFDDCFCFVLVLLLPLWPHSWPHHPLPLLVPSTWATKSKISFKKMIEKQQ